MRTRLVAAALFAVLGAGCNGAELEPDGPPLPTSMAALGDSITAGVLSGGVTHSWSTGTEVDSHYQRLVAAGADLEGRVHNLARGGAQMTHAPDQAAQAVETGAEYVTVLFGGNDVCAPSVADMTPVVEYEVSFTEALGILGDGLPDALVLVASVPDVHRLREVFADHERAQQIWRMAGICASLLGAERTDEELQAVADRVASYNEVLQRVCGQDSRCRFDGGAVHAQDYEATHVSPVDFFHPSAAGQERLARVTWAAGYWEER